MSSALKGQINIKRYAKQAFLTKYQNTAVRY